MAVKSFEQLEDIVTNAIKDLNDKVGPGATVILSVSVNDGERMSWAAKWSGMSPATFGLMRITDKVMMDSLTPKEKA